MMWLLRISLVCLAAASMGVVGVALLAVASIRHPGYLWVAIASAVLWLRLSPLVYRQSLGMAISDPLSHGFGPYVLLDGARPRP